MTVRCVRCNTEFSSSHPEAHTCPNCHLVFEEKTRKSDEFSIVHSSDLFRQIAKHRLLEESEDKCAFHPDTDSINYCGHCGRPVCYVCAVESGDKCLCEPCVKETVDSTAEGKPQDAGKRGRRTHTGYEREGRFESISQAMAKQPYVAWDYRRQIGRLNALFTTWRQTFFSPITFFRGVRFAGDYRGPLLYGTLWYLVGLMAGIAWKISIYAYPMFVLLLRGESIDITIRLSPAYAPVTVALLLSPTFALLLLLAACAIYHVFVVLLTRQHAGFVGTLSVICYSTSTNIFFFMPLLGGIIGGIWHLILVVAGLKTIHRLSIARAFVVAIVPYTLFLFGSIAFMLWSVTSIHFELQNLSVDYILSLFGLAMG